MESLATGFKDFKTESQDLEAYNTDEESQKVFGAAETEALLPKTIPLLNS